MTAQDRLEQYPRLDLRGFPSPLHPLERFSEALGVEVWCKRDDIGSIGLAGNKVRKLEFELAHAVQAGADHIVTQGARLSNSARAAAAASAALGLGCTLVLSGDAPEQRVSNLLLDELFGAEVRLVGRVSWPELAQLTEDIQQDLRARGATPYYLPVGCSSPRGALAFAAAFLELQTQAEQKGVEFTTLVHASSSGGTHAGLQLGRALSGTAMRVRGIGVASDIYPDTLGTYASLATDAAALIGSPLSFGPHDMDFDLAYLGEGYGIPTEGTLEAILLLARTEGLLVDPIYSGKAVAALVDLARTGQIEGPVVFWHTGGYHALFDPRHGDAVLAESDHARA
ncbi:1-aminocyclopropane-1-carboxylate deaminase/D-cysteine desulfhydrase [Compostimonas suwonensis]|uniref:1-aminocyclopropane-1-carboxylate deaminase/D-cysteine desulfhydrase n=1 Tax=Compostimonas suwonensis TaxID=1048394 RepID=A0A2M9BUR8_9MICO|nr:pyridoxal-phosphate dependent enzyme [Compostimonas suwonensis]PJJ61696.1 1-aminocyclopropane-1-carboxylate deaminase/D-cysteine desulfhydrase [Compostimonas suwonensis]